MHVDGLPLPPHMHRYFVLNKPYKMVSQFKSDHRVGLLGDLDFDFPEGTHAIGRLDSTSEGLLLLTTNKRVTVLLFQGAAPHRRTYLVRVRGEVSSESLQQLRTGVSIRLDVDNYYLTPPCEVEIVNPPATLQPYQLEANAQVPHTWLQLSLYEGKYHQVRKMVAAVNHHCRRLIRTSIEDIHLGDLPPGHVRELEETEFFRLLKIDNWQR